MIDHYGKQKLNKNQNVEPKNCESNQIVVMRLTENLINHYTGNKCLTFACVSDFPIPYYSALTECVAL